MKKRIIGMLLVLVMLVGMVPMSTIRVSAAEHSKVAFNLSGYRAGNRMTDLVLTGPDSVATYSGYLNVSKLEEGTSYDFTVLLTWKDGVSFTGDPTKDITLDGLLPETVEKRSSGDGYVLTYGLPDCPGQSVSEVGVFGLDAPVPGAHPDFTANVSNPYAYKFSRYGEGGCGFYWFDSEGVPLTATDTFEAGQTYSLEIKLEPNMANGVSSFKTPVTAMLNGNYADKMANSKNVYIMETFDCTPAVLVAGVDMIDGDYLAVGATKTQRTKPSGGYAYLKGNTLTLNNYQYEGMGGCYGSGEYPYYAVVHTRTSLEIILEGTNTLTHIIDFGIHQVIAASGRAGITISGNGTLNATGDRAIYVHYGGYLNINGGTINATATDYYGFQIDGAITINGGHINVTAWYNALYAYDNLTINGGTVTAISTDNGSALSAYESVTISDQLLVRAATEYNGTLGEYIPENNNSYSYVVISSASAKDVTVNCIGKITYTVSGQTVTVNHSLACKVGYLSGGSYVAIAATKNGDGTYSFTAPAGVTEVVLLIKGDVSLDGRLNVGDTSKVYSHVKKTALLTDPIALFAADVTGDGRINVGDTSKIYAHVKKTSSLTW